MTSQTRDLLTHGHATYRIERSSAELFEPSDHGLNVQPWSSAEWRGFWCRYAIVDGRLRLREVAACIRSPETARSARLATLRSADRNALERARERAALDMPYESLLEDVEMSLQEYEALVSSPETCIPPSLFGVAPRSGLDPVADGERLTFDLDVAVPFTGWLEAEDVASAAVRAFRFHDGLLTG